MEKKYTYSDWRATKFEHRIFYLYRTYSIWKVKNIMFNLKGEKMGVIGGAGGERDTPIFICSHIPINTLLFTWGEVRVQVGSQEGGSLETMTRRLFLNLMRTHS
jgi:hypothetical protein